MLAGGVGGARFLRGLRAAAPEARITAVVNTGDDVTMHGLRICPDLDTVVYTLGGGIDEERGWGRAGESWTVKEELAAYGAEPDLVRPRRPRPRHPPGPHPDARRRLPALPGHRGPRRPLAARRDRAADERPAGRDPRRRAPTPTPAGSGRSTSRSGGCATARPSTPPPSSRSASTTARPAPGRGRGLRRRRRRPARAVATRSSRSARSSACPGCARRCWPPAAGSSGSRRSSAARSCAAWPTAACRCSASRSAPRASAGTTAPGPTAACSTPGWSRRTTRPTSPASTSGTCRC